MDSNCSNSIVKNLIAKILCQKDILPEDYKIIIDTLSRRNNENVYLIYTLKYLGISSDIIDLLITSYETKELFYFLSEEKNDSWCCNDDEAPKNFTPMTEEEALKKSFADERGTIEFPAPGEIGQVTERFSFYDDELGKYFDCERIYRIDSTGQVVGFVSEEVTPQNGNGVNRKQLYAGILGQEFFKNKIN